MPDGAEKARLSLCCRVGTFVTGESCAEAAAEDEDEAEVQLPTVYGDDLVPTNVSANDRHFVFLVWNPCAGENRYPLTPHTYDDETWYLLANGTVYLPLAEEAVDRLLDYRQYCLARVRGYEYPEYLVFFCEAAYPGEGNGGGAVYSYGMLASVVFLIVTYLVYCLLPELGRNLHGLTLRGYVGCLATAYSMLAVLQLTSQEWITYGSCIAIGETEAASVHFSTHQRTNRLRMRRSSMIVARWCAFLLVAASANALAARTDSTGGVVDDEADGTIRYEPRAGVNATTRDHRDEADAARYQLSENSTTTSHDDDDDDDGKVQYEFRSNSSLTNDSAKANDDGETRYEFRDINSTNLEHRHEEDRPRELRANSTETDGKGNSTEGAARSSSEFPATTSVNYDVITTMCDSDTCIPLCCAPGERLVSERCVPDDNDGYLFPSLSDNTTSPSSSNRSLNEMFRLIVRDPCQISGRFMLNPVDYPDDEYVFLTNGSLYQPISDVIIQPTSYCLAVVHGNRYDVTVCFASDQNDSPVVDANQAGKPIGLIVSLPFLLMTFVVYSVLPELWNMHGYTLRGYVGSLFVAYTVLAALQLTPQQSISDPLCIAMAFIIHFSFLASFFWLNVMCFDIWWTFGGFRSLQGSVKQRERKKFIMYSIYAWGSASVLTIICAIMDFVPSVPRELIRPEFGVERCWFSTDAAKALYFYGPMGVTVICNICLFISTAFKIVRHKRDTAHHLRSSESRRHDDNKQWFNLYLKLFIVMGINWSMEIVSWLFKSAPDYVWYLTDLTNTLQGLIIFVTFVWKKKIKRLLLKRFGCQEGSWFSRNSTRSGLHSSASRSCTTTTSVMPLQEKISPYVHANYRSKSSDEAECP